MTKCFSSFLATTSNIVAKAKLKKIFGVFFIASLMTGCATYHPKPITSSDKASAFEARTLGNPALKKFIETNLHHEVRPWPPEAWDFTLLSLAAIYYHPELDEARARQNSAEAAVITAGAHPNPSLAFKPEFSANPPAGVSPWILGATLDIPIETAGKRGYRLNRAKYLAQATGFKLADTAWQVRSKLRKALLDLSAARQIGPVVEKQAKLAEELVMLFRQRMAAGEVSENEVNTAQIFLAQTRLQLQGMLTRETEARVNVASSIGLPVNALDNILISNEMVEQVPSLAALSLPDIRRRALLSRPDVLAVLAEYDAAESSVRLEIAKQYPDIKLGPGYQWDQGQNKWIFGFSVALPVFNRNEGPIAEAEARRGEAEARFVALQARIIGAIDKATVAFNAASRNLATVNSLITFQKNQLDSLVAMYNAGEIDRDALLNAQLEYHGAELSRLNALIALQDAFGRLEDALHYPPASGTQSSTFPEAIPETIKDR